MRIHINLIPEEIKQEYNIAEFTGKDGYIYIEVIGAIYGLSQSGYLANQDLIKNLATFGYHPVKNNTRTVETQNKKDYIHTSG